MIGGKILAGLTVGVFLILGTVNVCQGKIDLISKPRNDLEDLSEEIKPPKVKCDCSKAPLDILVCANNGLTYTSSCSFQCAARRVPTLGITKAGTCAGVTLADHQAASKKKKPY